MIAEKMYSDKKINLAEFLLEHNRYSANTPILSYQNQEFDLNDIKHSVYRTVHYFEEIGLQASEKVILLQNDTPAFHICFLALITIGAIPIPLNPKTESSALEYIIEDSQASTVLIGGSEFNLNKSLLESCKNISPNRIIIQDIFENEYVTDFYYPRLSKNFTFLPEKPKYLHKNASDVAFWQYTSGTTGKPKAVQHSHETMIVMTGIFAQNALKINTSDIIYSIPKMFFGYGLGNSLFFPLITGAKAIIESNWPTQKEIEQNIQIHQPTIFFSVPKVYIGLLRNAEDKTIKVLNKSKVLFSAGAHIGVEILQKWEEKFHNKIIDGIGCTELGHVYLSNTPSEINNGTTGKPLFNIEVKINAIQNIQRNGEVEGELLVRPPFVLNKYWNKPEQNEEKYSGNWYHTGDIFKRDKEGNYTYVSRVDDLFKSNGRWVNPAKIENLVVRNFEVEECIVVPFGESLDQKIGLVFTCSHEKGQEIALEISNFLYAILSGYEKPSVYKLIDEIPRNYNGKIMRKAIQKRLEIDHFNSISIA